jgi:hypothetical protein
MGPILRHLGEFAKIRLLPGENTHFFTGGGSVLVSKKRAMTDFQFLNYIENLITLNSSMVPIHATQYFGRYFDFK